MADITVIDGEHIELYIEEFGIQVPNAETVYNTANPALDRANGGIQVVTLAANATLTANLFSGQSITVMLDTNGFSVDTTAFKTEQSFMLDASAKNLLCIFNISGTKYITAAGRF